MSSNDGTERKPRAELASQLDILVADVETSPTTAFLVGLSGRLAGKLIRIKEGDSILGRSPNALVVLDEKAVSQQHAKLVFRVGQCVLVDLGSTNGTYLNDVRLTQPVELHAGDVIRLGKAVFGFLTDAADQEQHTRALARVSTSAMATQRRTVGPLTMEPSAMGPGELAPVNPLDGLLDKLALAAGFVKTYWRSMVLGSAIGALVGACTIFVRPPQATAEFLIALRHQSSDEAPQQGRFMAQSAEYFRHPEANFLSLELVRESLQSLGISPNPGLVFGTSKSLKFEMVQAGVYRGQYFGADAAQAERFLGKHLQNYLEAEITKSIKVLSSEVKLLRKQYQDTERSLGETEKNLKTFKETHLAGLPQNAAGQLEARAGLQTRVVELQANLERYTQELALSKKQYAEGDAIVAARVDRTAAHSGALGTTRQKLAAARGRGLTSEHPEVQALLKEERELMALEQRAIGEETTDVERRANREYAAQGSRVGQLEVLVSSTKTELGLVSGRLGEIEKVTSMMPAVEAEFSELSRTLAASQNLHEHLYEQLKAKELKLEFDRASVAGRYELLEPLSASGVQPASTAVKRAAAGLAVGLLLAVVGGVLHLVVQYARRRSRGGSVIVSG